MSIISGNIRTLKKSIQGAILMDMATNTHHPNQMRIIERCNHRSAATTSVLKSLAASRLEKIKPIVDTVSVESEDMNNLGALLLARY